MQSHYPEQFERDMACTEADWLRWLAPAIGAHPWSSDRQAVMVSLGQGRLRLTWTVGSPRQIALMQMPRLLVGFAFDQVSANDRHDFMRRFDMYMQRGGG